MEDERDAEEEPGENGPEGELQNLELVGKIWEAFGARTQINVQGIYQWSL